MSLDVLREKFVCNLDACKGECCIEGDAGAPVELEEVEQLSLIHISVCGGKEEDYGFRSVRQLWLVVEIRFIF